MTRAVTWIVLVTAVAAATGLFLLKNEVQRLEAAVRAERAAARAEYKAIEVLEADWSALNSPLRLARLARGHLDLAPLEPTQTLRIEAIPMLASDAEDDGSAPAAEAAIHLVSVTRESR